MPFDAEIITLPTKATLAGALAAYEAACAGSNRITFEDAAHMMAEFLKRPKEKAAKAPRAPSGAFTPANLAAALQRLLQAMERRNSIPILSNVRLNAGGGRLTLTGTDLDMVYSETLSAYVGPAFDTTVEALALAGLVKGASSVVFEAPEPRLGVVVNGARADLPTLPATDFPVMEPPADAASALVDAAALRGALGAVQYAISTEETRYYLNGAYLHFPVEHGRPVMRLVATDGHRLAMATEDAPTWDKPPAGIIIPRKAVCWLAKHLPAEGEVMLESSAERLTVTLPNGTFATKLVDGSYPDYPRIVPRDPGSWEIRIDDAKAFAADLSRLMTISAEKSRSVRLFAAAGEVEGTVRNMEMAQVRATLPAVHAGAEDREIGFNGRYLLDAVTAPCVIHLGGPNDPARVEYPDAPGRLAVLMPLRV